MILGPTVGIVVGLVLVCGIRSVFPGKETQSGLEAPTSTFASAPKGTITFNRDVAPIVFQKCAGCHRPGQSAPFALLTYPEVKKHARQIAEALPLVEEAFRGEPGPFAVQAAIAAVHCQAVRAEDTDWHQIVRLYDLLERQQPSPIVSLNRAVAVAMADGLRRGLVLIDALAAAGDLDEYHLLHAARADLLRRVGSREEAANSYERALKLVTNDSERRFLERRLREVQTAVT